MRFLNATKDLSLKYKQDIMARDKQYKDAMILIKFFCISQESILNQIVNYQLIEQSKDSCCPNRHKLEWHCQNMVNRKIVGVNNNWMVPYDH